ncbi:UNVERIFIED_CONTAM: hypothetical protein K2H54_039257 [Gekko kuhli]
MVSDEEDTGTCDSVDSAVPFQASNCRRCQSIRRGAIDDKATETYGLLMTPHAFEPPILVDASLAIPIVLEVRPIADAKAAELPNG